MENRKTYLDWLRVIAVILMLYNHLPAHALAKETGQFLYVFPAVLTRMNVPLFLMVSGALLLGREEDIRTLLRKRVLRIAVVLAVALTGLYLLRTLHDSMLHGTPFVFSVSDVFYGLFSRKLAVKDSGSYWYLYAYLGYLLMLPFLRGAARHMRRSHFILLTAIHAGLCTVLPLVNLALAGFGLQAVKLTDDFSVPLAAVRAMFYPLAGYWLDHGEDAAGMSRRRTALLACGAVCAAVAASLLYGSLGDKKAMALTEWFLTMACFLLVKRIAVQRAENRKTERRPMIQTLSGLVFGIYLLDSYWRLILFGAYYKVASVLPEMLSSLLWIPVTMAAGGAATWLLKKIPGVGKFL